MQEQTESIQEEVERAIGQLQVANIAQAKTIKRQGDEITALRAKIAELEADKLPPFTPAAVSAKDGVTPK